MPIDEIEIRNAVAEVLEITPEQLIPSLCLEDIPDFDSVKVLSLLVILDDLGIRLTQAEAANLKTYQDILTLGCS